MLRKHREQGLLQPRTKWRRYRDIIRKDPEYLCMETNISGSRPRELFADVMWELEDTFLKVCMLCVLCMPWLLAAPCVLCVPCALGCELHRLRAREYGSRVPRVSFCVRLYCRGTAG